MSDQDTQVAQRLAETGLALFRQLVSGKNALRVLEVFSCNLAEHDLGCECFWEQCEAWAKADASLVDTARPQATVDDGQEVLVAHRIVSQSTLGTLDKAANQLIVDGFWLAERITTALSTAHANGVKQGAEPLPVGDAQEGYYYPAIGEIRHYADIGRYEGAENVIRKIAAAAYQQGAEAERKGEWVTFGRIKMDVETETETFERIYPPQPVREGVADYNAGLKAAMLAVCRACSQPELYKPATRYTGGYWGHQGATHASFCYCAAGRIRDLTTTPPPTVTPQDGWQPIATAPVDTLIRIMEKETGWVGTGIRKVHTDADSHTESYCQVLHYNGEVLVRAFYATHWMPPVTPSPIEEQDNP